MKRHVDSLSHVQRELISANRETNPPLPGTRECGTRGRRTRRHGAGSFWSRENRRALVAGKAHEVFMSPYEVIFVSISMALMLAMYLCKVGGTNCFCALVDQTKIES